MYTELLQYLNPKAAVEKAPNRYWYRERDAQDTKQVVRVAVKLNLEENISLSTLVNDLEVDYIQGHALAMANHEAQDRLDKAKHDEIKQKLGW